MGRNNLKVKRGDTVNIPVTRNKNNPVYSKFFKIWDIHSVSCSHRQLVFFTVLLVIYVYMFLHILKGRGPGINSSQSKNVGKIQLSMQLSHLSIIFENIWF